MPLFYNTKTLISRQFSNNYFFAILKIVIVILPVRRHLSYWQPAVKASRKLNPFALPLKTKIIRAKLGDDANLFEAYFLTKINSQPAILF
jgi:hypothetical protein